MRVLAISLAFPPLAYPRSVQVARLLKNADVATVLLCADEPGVRLDPSIEPDAEKTLAACIRIPVRSGKTSKMINALSHRFYPSQWKRRNLVPDAYGGWKKSVVAAALKHVRDNDFKPDVLVTFAQPFTDHLIGLELKTRLGIPWLAHFSDPWADNPFSPFDSSTKELNSRLESKVAESADILAFTSQETVDLFFQKYPKELKAKARVLPQCFNEGGPELATPIVSERIVVRYLGNFYGRRTPAPLIKALNLIHSRDARFLDNTLFELVGPGDAEEVGGLSNGLPSGLLTTRPSVPYSESIRLMEQADGLLVIDAPADLSVFLPSKLIDYIGTGRPVYGITPPGAAAGLIRDLGGKTADPSSIEAIAEGLSSFLIELKERRSLQVSTRWGTPDARDRFRAARIAGDFRVMLEELVH